MHVIQSAHSLHTCFSTAAPTLASHMSAYSLHVLTRLCSASDLLYDLRQGNPVPEPIKFAKRIPPSSLGYIKGHHYYINGTFI